MFDMREIREWLNRYGALLCHGDAKTLAQYWEVPAHVLTEDADVALEDIAAVEEHVTRVQDAYQAGGISSVIPRVDEAVDSGPGQVALQVVWTNLDYDDHEIGQERAHYVLHRGDDAKYRVRIATPLTKAGSGQ